MQTKKHTSKLANDLGYSKYGWLTLIVPSIIAFTGCSGQSYVSAQGNAPYRATGSSASYSTSHDYKRHYPKGHSSPYYPKNQPINQRTPQTSTRRSSPLYPSHHYSLYSSQPVDCQDMTLRKTTLDLINKIRSQGRSCGRKYYPPAPALRWNTQLESSARGHAQDMARNNYFSHKSLNGSNYAKRIAKAGYPRNSYKAENIAAGRASVDLAMKRLVNSPAHCKNIMNPVYNDFAMACAYNENSKFEYYWVQNFGKKVFAR